MIKHGEVRLGESNSDFDHTKKAEYFDELGYEIADAANKDKLKKPVKITTTKESNN